MRRQNAPGGSPRACKFCKAAGRFPVLHAANGTPHLKTHCLGFRLPLHADERPWGRGARARAARAMAPGLEAARTVVLAAEAILLRTLYWAARASGP